MGAQLQINRRMEQRLPVAVHLRHNGGHILQVAFRQHRLLQIIGVAPVHAVLVGGIADDFLFLHRGHMTGINTQGDAVLFAKVRQDGLLIGGGRIVPQRPHTTIGVAADEVVGFKFYNGRRDHIQKFLNTHILLDRERRGFYFLQTASSFQSSGMIQRSPSKSSNRSVVTFCS